jgi:hypothetical protein
MFGYVVERSGVTWAERFWFDIPAVGAKGFGDDARARVFHSEAAAKAASLNIEDELGFYCYVTKRSELYPPAG